MLKRKLAVVGAGITGLTVSSILTKRGINVDLFDKKGAPGGAIKSAISNGWLFEYGPNTLLLRDKIIADFINENGLDNEIIIANENASKRYIVKNGQLEPLPTSILKAIGTPLLTATGKFRLLKEPFISRNQNSDQTVAEFVERRLGEEVLNYAINPFVAGIFANNPEALSLRHAFPSMHDLEEEYGSLIWGSFAGAKKRRQDGRIPRKLISFKSGLQKLALTLSESIGKKYFNHKVEKVEKKGKDWFVLSNSENYGPYDKVIVNTPLYQMQQTFLPISDNELNNLKLVNYPPLSVLHLGFKKENVSHPLDGFGFLVPELENRNILGGLFSSTLFDNRAPEGNHLLTVFVGGGRQPELASLETTELLKLVMHDLNDFIGIKGDPVIIDHAYWPNSIPAYHVGYDEILQTLKNIEVRNPGLHLAGNFRNGISVPDCIKNGIELADTISAQMIHL